MPDTEGRKKPNTKKQKARAANVAIFGRAADKTETSGDYAVMQNKLLPKSHTDMRKVFSHVNAYIEQLTGDKTPGVSLLHKNTMIKLYNTAMREPFEDVNYVKCPKCKKEHLVYCPNCEEPHPIVLPNAQFEKNTLTALCKLADKTSPNLAAITQDINVNFLVTNITEFCVKLITRYVPTEQKQVILQELNATMTKVVDAEYQDITPPTKGSVYNGNN